MNINSENTIRVIKEQGVIPLFYHDDATVCLAVADALYNAGIRVIEFTDRGSKAVNNFKLLLEKRKECWPEVLFCAGTIKTPDVAQQFIDAGADFIICPAVIPEVAKTVHNAGLLWVPGCMSATEIAIAEQNGATLIKLFPGSLLQPAYVTAVKEIYPDLLFMPTGGVDINEENLSAWLKAGVAAVGLGSKVISKEVLENKQYGLIEQAAAKALMLVKKIKSQISNNDY